MMLGIGLALFLATGASSVLAQDLNLAMFRDLAKGEWTVKFRDGSPARKICVRSGREFIQLQHSRSDCSQFVVEDKPSNVKVQYTCAGDGYGRTDIRRETSSLLQIEGQGIGDGKPYRFVAEARRTGACSR